MTAKREYLWRCECGGGHFMSLTIWGSDLDLAGYFYIEGDFSSTWRHRLHQAWKIIRNGHEGSWVGVILTQESARDIITALQEYLREIEQTS